MTSPSLHTGMVRPLRLLAPLAFVLGAVLAPASAQPTAADVERDVDAALEFQHGPSAIAWLADSSLVTRMRAYPDLYKAHLLGRVDGTLSADDPALLSALELRARAVDLARVISNDVVVDISRVVLDQVAPLASLVSAAHEDYGDRVEAGELPATDATYDEGSRLQDRVEAVAGTYGQALRSLAAVGDTSYADVALDITREFYLPGGRWPIDPRFYVLSDGYLRAVADALPRGEDVEPIPICYMELSNGGAVARFGARTESIAVVHVPLGPDNRFESSAGREIPQTPPQFFRAVSEAAGGPPSFLTITYPEPGEAITWHLLGKTATVDASTRSCREIWPDRYVPVEPEPPSDTPLCNGKPATVYVRDGLVVGGELDGQPYDGLLRGTDGPDVMVGTDGPDQIAGFAGDDALCGLGGDDLLQGNGDADILYGGPGNDVLAGGNGGDTIYGDDGTDEARGGRGNDACDAETKDSCEREIDE